MHRRNHFIGQANSMLCIFGKLDLFVKIKLFKSYCSSIYGCELWSLNGDAVQSFCCAWRSALRRLLDLPFDAHSYLLHAITTSLPILDEICKRSAHFVATCLNSRSQLVRNIAWHSVVYGRHCSVLGGNILFCCRRYGWDIDDFLLGRVSLQNIFFQDFCDNYVGDDQACVIHRLSELILLREGYCGFSYDGVFLSKKELQTLINYTASA